MNFFKNTLIKIDDSFSTTKKLYDYIRRPQEKEGYLEVVSGLPETIDGYPADTKNSAFWRFISGACEDVGNKVYERIDRLISNVSDIDTCELNALYSICKELGYNGDTTFLTFTYPKEIYELLSILSVNKDIIFSSEKILNSLQKTTFFETLSADPTGYTTFPLMSGYSETIVDSPTSALAYSAEDWADILELSGIGYLTEEYNFIPDTNFINLIDNLFLDCLSGFVFLKYRYEELYGINNLSETSGYIWEHITDRIDESLLYLDNKNKTDEILELKLRLGVPLSFNEFSAADAIEFKTKKFSDFTIQEQQVIQAEFQRRETERETVPNIQRWKFDRERKVIEYFRFIEKFNQIDPSIYFKPYELDENLMELSGSQSSTFLYVSSCEFHVDTSYLYSCAYSLRNIALKISYLRQYLKSLAQRSTLKGTSTIIEILIEELFKKYYFDPSLWRYCSGATSNFRTISAEQDSDFSAKIIEYYDTSEYFNISALPAYSNEEFSDEEYEVIRDPYWLNDDILNPNIDSSQVLESDISGFYKNQLGLDFVTVPELSGVSGYTDYLNDFLSRIFKSSALSAYNTNTSCSFNYVSSQQFLNGIISGAEYLNTAEETSAFNGFSLTGNITYSDYFKNHPSGNISGIALSATLSSYVPVYKQVSGGTLRLKTNVDEQVIFENYIPSGEYYISGAPSGFTIYNYFKISGAIAKNLAFYDITSDDITYQLVSGIISGNIYPMNPQEGSSIAPSGISAQFFAQAPSANIQYYTDPMSGVYYRNIGTISGITPYYNHKNLTHPSYALHPFIRGLFEIGYDLYKSVYRLTTQLVGTVQSDFDNLIYRIDEYGNTVQSWRSDNNELIHYQTYYEGNTNLDDDGNINKNIAIDGPWNISALQDFLNDTEGFISSVSAGTNQFYQNIGLTLQQQEEIAYRLCTVSGNEDEGLNSIRGLKNKRIFQYTVDVNENNYMLYKDDISYDLTGRIWMRYANHPLCLPFASLSGMEYTVGECGETSDLSQFNTVGHRQFGSGPNQALDFGIAGAWMWLAYGNNLQPNIAYGQIIQDPPYNRIIRDFYHNYEGFTLSGSGRTYVGTYVQQGVFHTISILADESTLFALPYSPTYNRYLASLHFDVFDPKNGTSFFNRNASVAYNTTSASLIYYELSSGELYELPDGSFYVLPGSDFGDDFGSSGFRNIFRLAKGKETLAVGYDAHIPLTGNYPITNVFGDTSYNQYRELYQCAGTLSGTQIPVTYPETGVTVIYFEQEVNETEPGTAANVLYHMPFSRLGFVGIFPEPSATNNFNTLFNTEYAIPPIDYFYIELFTDITPSAYTGLRKGRFSVNSQEYECLINFDKYRAYENVPVSGLYLSDAHSAEDDIYTVISRETPPATAYTQFMIMTDELSGLKTFLEFDNEELGKTLSAITEDETYIHQFKYAGKSGFTVSAIPNIDS